MSTSSPMALCRATDDPTPTPRVATGIRHGARSSGEGVFSSRRRMKRANRVRLIPIASDRGSEPTVIGRSATMIECLVGRQPPQTGSPRTADVSPPPGADGDAQIDRDDAMGATEVFELGGQVRMVPAPAVHHSSGGAPLPTSVYASATPSRLSRSTTHLLPIPVSQGGAHCSHQPHGVSTSGPRASKFGHVTH
jgi:hypothetical protein